MRKLYVGAALVLVIGISGYLILRPNKPAASAKPAKEATATDPNVVELSVEAQRNMGLVLAKAAEATVRSVVKTTGIVSEDQARVAHIFPLARGIVEMVNVQLGDKVTQGQPLVSFDNIELGQLRGEYLNLRGGLVKLQAQQRVAEQYLSRARALIDVQAIAQRELELRQAEYEAATASVQSQQAEIARVEEQLHRFGLTDEDIRTGTSAEHGSGGDRSASHGVLRAPRSGVITKFDVSRGEIVETTKELLTIVDTSVVWILGDVYEKDLGAVRAGGKAMITIASYPDQKFTGQVTYVSDYLDPASRTAKVRCVVQNQDGRLKLEMFATVEIPSSRERKALAVSPEALQQVNNETVLFVQRDATHFEKRVVQVGEKGEGAVEVRSGIQPGETIVANGSFYLKSALMRERIGGEE